MGADRILKMKHVVDFCEKVVSGHHEDHADCWCCPKVETLDNGDKLVIHSDIEGAITIKMCCNCYWHYDAGLDKCPQCGCATYQ